jgi:hypothetical protein
MSSYELVYLYELVFTSLRITKSCAQSTLSDRLPTGQWKQSLAVTLQYSGMMPT